MISERLLPLSIGCYDGTTIMAKTGHQIAQAENIDDAKDIVACVNAIHEAGLDPADLPKFVEAVRALANAHDVNEDYEAHKMVYVATKCLPENKEKP